ncbi:hypothetical protein GWK47_015871 [Chionoecetes opilio]|uniref:Uncharacterized protein n=1 Tax=Chionoecetes opilio TaxID=41210 RepID=A0A8J4XSZ1_CHIOP|nr:hypothetical protein GWK47_015871 [Chionoecetes opilio]
MKQFVKALSTDGDCLKYSSWHFLGLSIETIKAGVLMVHKFDSSSKMKISTLWIQDSRRLCGWWGWCEMNLEMLSQLPTAEDWIADSGENIGFRRIGLRDLILKPGDPNILHEPVDRKKIIFPTSP